MFLIPGDELKTILKNARLSLACTEMNGKVKTAYMLLETDAAEQLDKFYRMYAPFSAALGGKPLDLNGWSSAASMKIPFYDGDGINIILAHKQGTLLIGAGDAGDFSKSSPFGKEYKNYTAKDNVVNIIASSKLYDILLSVMGGVSPAPPRGEETRESLKNRLTALRDSFRSFCVNLQPSGRSDGRIVFAEGGDPAGAVFDLISQIAFAAP
jgi:hypothetical protein